MKIIYGTGNQNKVAEIKTLFKNHNIETEILSLKDIGFNEEIDEIGENFEENSMIKAKAIKEFCNKNNINEIIITDDAGLCVDSLNGAPGVHSARYAGDHASQEVTLNKLMNEMKDIPKEKRTSQFVCVLTAILPNDEIIVAKGVTKGSIAEEIGTMGGLTFCPVFIPEGYDVPMSELSAEEYENAHNHRDKAFSQLLEQI